MKRLLLLAILAVLALSPAQAKRDFLSTNEADQVRLTQEPNARLKLYATFAEDRILMLEQIMKKNDAGRSVLVREALEDYTKIIETIDVVADDALSRGVDITEGLEAATEAEQKFLESLEGVLDGDPSDLQRFRFVLATAIETTEDSIEINLEDLGDRKTGLAKQRANEQEKLESMMTPEMAEGRKEDTKELEEEEQETERKAPTLFKKGEKKPGEREPAKKKPDGGN
jgi:hypothetical protein